MISKFFWGRGVVFEDLFCRLNVRGLATPLSACAPLNEVVQPALEHKEELLELFLVKTFP